MSAPTSPTHHDDVSSDSDSPVVESTSHEWRPPQAEEARSPCPALNTLANHGFLPRDGKQLNAQVLLHGLQEGYGLSSALAHVLVYGGVALLGQFGSFQLSDLARHNRIEHDASLVHDDTPDRDEYAPITPNVTLIQQFLEQSQDGQVITVEDVARARVWRQSQCPVLTTLHAEIARGEMGVALGIFTPPDSDKPAIPVDMLRVWLSQERLPDGWKPTHTQGLLDTMRTTRQINNAMNKFENDGEDVAPPAHGEA